ncbi:MAG: hypothetical protein MHPSP_000496 [Paramarteilia canceri]
MELQETMADAQDLLNRQKESDENYEMLKKLSKNMNTADQTSSETLNFIFGSIAFTQMRYKAIKSAYGIEKLMKKASELKVMLSEDKNYKKLKLTEKFNV